MPKLCMYGRWTKSGNDDPELLCFKPSVLYLKSPNADDLPLCAEHYDHMMQSYRDLAEQDGSWEETTEEVMKLNA